MNGFRSRDPFGRPELVMAIGWITPALVAMIAGSVWPPSARSETPPFDTQARFRAASREPRAQDQDRGMRRDRATL